MLASSASAIYTLDLRAPSRSEISLLPGDDARRMLFWLASCGAPRIIPLFGLLINRCVFGGPSARARRGEYCGCTLFFRVCADGIIAREGGCRGSGYKGFAPERGGLRAVLRAWQMLIKEFRLACWDGKNLHSISVAGEAGDWGIVSSYYKCYCSLLRWMFLCGAIIFGYDNCTLSSVYSIVSKDSSTMQKMYGKYFNLCRNYEVMAAAFGMLAQIFDIVHYFEPL